LFLLLSQPSLALGQISPQGASAAAAAASGLPPRHQPSKFVSINTLVEKLYSAPTEEWITPKMINGFQPQRYRVIYGDVSLMFLSLLPNVGTPPTQIQPLYAGCAEKLTEEGAGSGGNGGNPIYGARRSINFNRGAGAAAAAAPPKPINRYCYKKVKPSQAISSDASLAKTIPLASASQPFAAFLSQQLGSSKSTALDLTSSNASEMQLKKTSLQQQQPAAAAAAAAASSSSASDSAAAPAAAALSNSSASFENRLGGEVPTVPVGFGFQYIPSGEEAPINWTCSSHHSNDRYVPRYLAQVSVLDLMDQYSLGDEEATGMVYECIAYHDVCETFFGLSADQYESYVDGPTGDLIAQQDPTSTPELRLQEMLRFINGRAAGRHQAELRATIKIYQKTPDVAEISLNMIDTRHGQVRS
jgi:hypothetical protein